MDERRCYRPPTVRERSSRSGKRLILLPNPPILGLPDFWTSLLNVSLPPARTIVSIARDTFGLSPPTSTLSPWQPRRHSPRRGATRKHPHRRRRI